MLNYYVQVQSDIITSNIYIQRLLLQVSFHNHIIMFIIWQLNGKLININGVIIIDYRDLSVS